MKKTEIIMGMPVTVEIVNRENKPAKTIKEVFTKVFNYFRYVDEKFSPFKESSELSKINKNLLKPDDYSEDMVKVLRFCEDTKKETVGYFDIRRPDGKIDTSGLVKGWAIYNASLIISDYGLGNFYVDAGGDIEIQGLNEEGEKWKVGIRNPFNKTEIIKVLEVSGKGVATSGSYERGNHIYDPLTSSNADEIESITLIADNIFNADRMATAVYAMGEKGINFIAGKSGYEAYMVLSSGQAVYTPGLENYVKKI